MPTRFPTRQSNPAGALPVWVAPPPDAATTNLTTATVKQVSAGPGSLQGAAVNSAGTTSTLVLYDGQSAVVTVSIATPAVVGWVGHGLAAGTPVFLETTGALPTGLTAGTTYYVSVTGLTADALQLADTLAHALAGTNSVATSGTQSGAQTAYAIAATIGTYTTTAQGNLPLPGGAVGLSQGLIAVTAGGSPANLTLVTTG